MAGDTQDDSRRRGHWRGALWAVAALALLVPLAAGWPWTTSDYVFAAVLMFGSLGLYELAARLTGNTAYRTGAAIAIAATFLLVWVNGAVGITDSEADGLLLLLLVPAVAFIGALAARFRPGGVAVAMFVGSGLLFHEAARQGASVEVSA